MDKIAIVGFGRIGSVIGSYLSKKNKVYGLDLKKFFLDSFLHEKDIFNEPGLIERVSKGIKNKNLLLTTDFSVIKKCKYIIVCVGTPLNKNKNTIDVTYLKKCINSISKYLNEKKILILKSSVIPGTTNKVFKKIIDRKKCKFAYCPERLAEGTAFKDIVNNEVIVGAYNQKSLKIVSNFWKKNSLNTIKLSSPEEAEITKLACNAWIDVNIGLANELAKIIDGLGLNIDVMNVIKAANTLKKGSSNVNILYPSLGVGGYCLTKDPIFLDSIKQKTEKNSILLEARKVNSKMPEYCAKKIIQHIRKEKLKINNVNLLILGATYKGNTDDVRLTPIFDFIKSLKQREILNISIFDSNIKRNDQKYFKCNFSNNLKLSLKKSNIVVIGADHDYIKKLTPGIILRHMKKKSLVFDGRRYFSSNDLKLLRLKKLNFSGIGR